MRRLFLVPFIVLTILLVSAMECFAQVPPGKRFGIGLSLGEPVAVTVKWRATRTTAFDFGIGHSVMGYPRIHGDYLWQFFFLFPQTNYNLNLYAGVGGAMGFGTKGKYLLFNSTADSSSWFYTKTVSAALRGVVGLNYFLPRPGLEFFAELNPLVGVLPKAALDFEGALGARFYLF